MSSPPAGNSHSFYFSPSPLLHLLYAALAALIPAPLCLLCGDVLRRRRLRAVLSRKQPMSGMEAEIRARPFCHFLALSAVSTTDWVDPSLAVARAFGEGPCDALVESLDASVGFSGMPLLSGLQAGAAVDLVRSYGAVPGCPHPRTHASLAQADAAFQQGMALGGSRPAMATAYATFLRERARSSAREMNVIDGIKRHPAPLDVEFFAFQRLFALRQAREDSAMATVEQSGVGSEDDSASAAVTGVANRVVSERNLHAALRHEARAREALVRSVHANMCV